MATLQYFASSDTTKPTSWLTSPTVLSTSNSGDANGVLDSDSELDYLHLNLLTDLDQGATVSVTISGTSYTFNRVSATANGDGKYEYYAVIGFPDTNGAYEGSVSLSYSEKVQATTAISGTRTEGTSTTKEQFLVSGSTNYFDSGNPKYLTYDSTKPDTTYVFTWTSNGVTKSVSIKPTSTTSHSMTTVLASLNTTGGPADGATWKAGSGGDARKIYLEFDTNGNIADNTTFVASLAINTVSTASRTSSLTIDTQAPSVGTVAITDATGVQNAFVNTGDVVRATVTMSEAVTVTTTNGIPTIELQVGTTQQDDGLGGTTTVPVVVTATYVSGSGSNQLVFEYQIQAGQNDADGISIAAGSVALNGAVVTDLNGNLVAGLTHGGAADNASYKVDTIAPNVALAGNTDPNNPSQYYSQEIDGVTYLIGTGEAGGAISVNITGNSKNVTKTATVAPDGTWNVIVPSNVPDGFYTVAVTGSDPAGNQTVETYSSVFLDTTDPGDATLTGFEFTLEGSRWQHDVGADGYVGKIQGLITAARNSVPVEENIFVDVYRAAADGSIDITSPPQTTLQSVGTYWEWIPFVEGFNSLHAGEQKIFLDELDEIVRFSFVTRDFSGNTGSTSVSQIISAAFGANVGVNNDTIIGTNNRDIIIGYAGSDYIDGNGERDFLFGGSESDTIRGGGGDDLIAGGTQADILEGGAGQDTFRYSRFNECSTSARDTIIDFNSSQDVIELINIYTSLGLAKATSVEWISNYSTATSTKRVAGKLWASATAINGTGDNPFTLDVVEDPTNAFTYIQTTLFGNFNSQQNADLAINFYSLVPAGTDPATLIPTAATNPFVVGTNVLV